MSFVSFYKPIDNTVHYFPINHLDKIYVLPLYTLIIYYVLSEIIDLFSSHFHLVFMWNNIFKPSYSMAMVDFRGKLLIDKCIENVASEFL
jgi:hypothetical protein